MRRPSFICCVTLVLCLGFVFGCGEDEDEDSSLGYNDYLAMGKTNLVENDSAHASNYFHDALEFEPSSVEAKTGLTLVGPMRFVNFIDQIIETISAITFDEEFGPDGEPTDKSLPQPGDPDYVHPIHEYLIEKVEIYQQAAELSYSEIVGEPDLQFELESYVIEMAGLEFFAMGGEFDLTDVHFVMGVNALLDGVDQFLLAHNLSYDYTAIGVQLSDEPMHIIETIDMIVQILDGLLYSEDFPNFLLLLEYGGTERMNQAGIQLGNAFARVGLSLDALKLETDDQSDDQVTYVDANGNGRYDTGVDDLLLGSLLIEADIAAALETAAANFAAAFYEGSPLDENPNVVDLLYLADLNELLRAFGVFPLDLGSIVIEGFPAGLGINVGSFFSDPSPDAIRNVLLFVVDLWNDPGSLFE
jgi:hypothetical protein